MKKEIIIAIISLVLSAFNVTFTNDTSALDPIKFDDYVTVTNKYPHSTDSFTQGLFYYKGEMFETTGLYGKSEVLKNIDIKTGRSEKTYCFDKSIFAEGSVVFKDELFVLTYRENKVFVFDPVTLELKREIPYSREGWGLTTDGEYLIASDGTEKIFFMNKNLETKKTITVKLNGIDVKNINELEYIDGNIWANEWLTNNILIINPKGNVIEKLDFTKICPKNTTDFNDVLNGIAYNQKTEKIYVTGKRWDTLYELKIKK